MDVEDFCIYVLVFHCLCLYYFCLYAMKTQNTVSRSINIGVLVTENTKKKQALFSVIYFFKYLFVN